MTHLLKSIEDFMRKHEMSESRFGELAINDRKLVSQVRGGRDLRMSTVTRIETFMDGYKPDQDLAASEEAAQ